MTESTSEEPCCFLPPTGHSPFRELGSGSEWTAPPEQYPPRWETQIQHDVASCPDAAKEQSFELRIDPKGDHSAVSISSEDESSDYQRQSTAESADTPKASCLFALQPGGWTLPSELLAELSLPAPTEGRKPGVFRHLTSLDSVLALNPHDPAEITKQLLQAGCAFVQLPEVAISTTPEAQMKSVRVKELFLGQLPFGMSEDRVRCIVQCILDVICQTSDHSIVRVKAGPKPTCAFVALDEADAKELLRYSKRILFGPCGMWIAPPAAPHATAVLRKACDTRFHMNRVSGIPTNAMVIEPVSVASHTLRKSLAASATIGQKPIYPQVAQRQPPPYSLFETSHPVRPLFGGSVGAYRHHQSATCCNGCGRQHVKAIMSFPFKSCTLCRCPLRPQSFGLACPSNLLPNTYCAAPEVICGQCVGAFLVPLAQ